MTLDEIEAYIRSYTGGPRPPGTPEPAITLRFLDQPVRLDFDPAHVDREQVVAAIRNLMALPAPTRAEVEPPLYAFYCQQMADGAGNFDTPQEQLDWEADYSKAKVPTFPNPRHATRSDEVWALVHFYRAAVYRSPSRLIVSLWAEAAWDGEHGAALHFEDGARFLSVTDLNDGPD